MPSQPRFISDVMLGGLSKWLRILGFDTLYFREIDDNELIKIAKQEQRILLTRDSAIAVSRKINSCILLKSNDTAGQLKELLTALKNSIGTVTEGMLPRCTECNGSLLSSNKEAVSNDIPEYVFLNFNSFFKCMDCGKVYWEGSHKRMIDAKIDSILKEI